MAEIPCKLKDGITGKDTKTGHETKHVDAVLHTLNAGEIIDANRDAERLFVTPDGPIAVVSPSEAMRQMLRRHIKKLGEIPGPLDEETFNQLSDADLKLLDKHAKKLGQMTSKEVGQTGRTDS